MDLNFTPEEDAFRAEVRHWLAENLPKRISDKVRQHKRMTQEDHEEWDRILGEKGWLCWLWPKEHGGAAFTPVQKHIFEEEMVAANAPRPVPFGPGMLGPVIIEFGTEEQKRHYLPKIISGEHRWCQGYSEPGAGSDLASLKTTAVRDADHFIVNGQKTWTTLGHFANWIFCLVRTDPNAAKPQEGISFLLIDMKSSGVEVRPIITLDGEHEVNEVWLTDVKVPAENLVGEENKGWTCAKYLLTYERTGAAGVPYAKKMLNHLKQVAAREMQDGRPLDQDPMFAARMAEVEIDILAMEHLNLRVVSAAGQGKVPGAESSLLKLKGSTVRQEMTDLLRRAVGPYAMPYVPEAFDEGFNEEPIGPEGAMPLANSYFNMRKLTIYGGSSEVQRNIIAKAMLEL